MAENHFEIEFTRLFDGPLEKGQPAVNLMSDNRSALKITGSGSVISENAVECNNGSNKGDGLEKSENCSISSNTNRDTHKVEGRFRLRSGEPPLEKYIKLLVNFKNRCQEVFQNKQTRETKFEFRCLDQVLNEILMSRKLRNRGFASELPTKILTFHIEYLERKREEYMKIDTRHRGLFLSACALLRRLRSIKHMCETELESLFYQ